MRWWVGCLIGGLLACFVCACLGGAVTLISAGGGGSPQTLPLLRMTEATRDPVISAAAAASFDRKVEEFNRQLASGRGQPATLTVTSDEVSSKLATAVEVDQLRQSGIELHRVVVDFRDNRAFFAGQVRLIESGQQFGVTGKVNVVPVRGGNAIRLDFDELNVVGLLPFPLPLAGIVNSWGAAEREIQTTFRVESIQMTNGQLIVVARP